MANRWKNPQNCPILSLKCCIPLVFMLLSAGIMCYGQDQEAVVYLQEGLATQELPIGGLSARHHSLPIGSRPIVRNLKTGAEIEVSIISRVPASNDRIIDLSPSAAEALGLENGDTVLVFFTPQPFSPTTIEPQSVPQASGVVQQAIQENNSPLETPQPQVIQHPPQIIRIQEPLPQLPQSHPINTDQYQQVQPQQPLPQQGHSQPEFPIQVPSGPNNPELNWLAWLSYMTALSQRSNSGNVQHWQAPPQPHVQQHVQPPVQQQAQQPYQGPPPPNTVRVVPGLPNPDSGKLYHLLVGAYSSADNASIVIQHLHGAGFSAMIEQTNNQFRVSATAIPAPYVYEAVQRLGALGFMEIWVSE